MKVLTCVARNQCGGTVRCHQTFRRLERKASGSTSASCTVSETAEGAEIVWDHVTEDLQVFSTSHGHRVSLRKVIETEILNCEQGLRTPDRKVLPSGRKEAPAPKSLEVKVTAALRDSCKGEEAPATRVKQTKYIIKITQ